VGSGSAGSAGAGSAGASVAAGPQEARSKLDTINRLNTNKTVLRMFFSPVFVF
jgi:hypothetical protein